VRAAAEQAGLDIQEIKPSSGQSDEASFYRKDIPGIHFFTGVHADWHRPSDDTEKINEQDAVRILALVHDVALRISEAKQRPTFQTTGGFASMRSRGNRVVMGIFPDYTGGKAAGLLIERIVPNGPADKAGMKVGDRIVRIADQKVDGLEDYMEAVRSKKAGDDVEVVVARGDQEVALAVQLTAG